MALIFTSSWLDLNHILRQHMMTLSLTFNLIRFHPSSKSYRNVQRWLRKKNYKSFLHLFATQGRSYILVMEHTRMYPDETKNVRQWYSRTIRIRNHFKECPYSMHYLIVKWFHQFQAAQLTAIVTEISEYPDNSC